jgi:hypothetical protein
MAPRFLQRISTHSGGAGRRQYCWSPINNNHHINLHNDDDDDDGGGDDTDDADGQD